MSELSAILEKQMKLLSLPEPKKEFKFHPVRRWRFDFCWPEIKFAVEVDGGVYVQGRHNRGAGYENDLEKMHEAHELGWTVYRCGKKLINSGAAVNLIEKHLKHTGVAR